jgi:hypothetical protein
VRIFITEIQTQTERLDRNWSSLLQELRVTLTGVQLPTGFLLTLPFSSALIGSTAICGQRRFHGATC